MTQDAPLRLGLGAQVPAALFGPVLQDLERRLPTLGLTVQHGTAAALNEWLLHDQIDVAVLDDADALAEQMSCWPLYQDRLAVLMPAGHALAGYAEVPAAALSGERLVARAGGCRLSRALDALVIEHRCGDMPRHLGADEAAVHGLVLAGLGLALGAMRQAVPWGLASRPLAPPAEPFSVVVAAVAERPAARAADAFLRMARDWLA